MHPASRYKVRISCCQGRIFISLSTFLDFCFAAIPEDGVKEESEDEESMNADERAPPAVTDKRIIGENEYSDSEDEGPVGGGRKDSRYLSLLTAFLLIC